MQMPDRPPHAICAIDSVDENQLETCLLLKGASNTPKAEMGSVIIIMCWFLCKAISYKRDEGGKSRKKCYPPCTPIEYNPNLVYILFYFIFKFTCWFFATGFCNRTSYIENAVDEHKYACLCLDFF
ncbi:unnamed protein product [Trifolium pratense]|uniref:Uncharacterized protein n=1 Tax=Trifolium pratense TaxID=57577 RepID=A0ACB0KV44_TRIPR|nr:unnamed protein product [Trifolium pratense]